MSLTRGRGAVWTFTLVLAAAGAALYLHVHTHVAPVSELRLPWWALAAAFAVTEASSVHVHSRRGAHTLTLVELPLVLGLLLASPGDVMIGWVVGAAVAIALSRSYVPAKIGFNLAQLAVTAGLATVILQALTGPGSELGPRVWLAAGAAVLAAAAASAVLVAAAMWLSGETMRMAKVSEMVAMAVVVAATNTSLGLAAGTVIGTDPRGGVLLIAPVVAVFLAYRAYTAQRLQHTNLEFLFQASRTLSSAPGPGPRHGRAARHRARDLPCRGRRGVPVPGFRGRRRLTRGRRRRRPARGDSAARLGGRARAARARRERSRGSADHAR